MNKQHSIQKRAWTLFGLLLFLCWSPPAWANMGLVWMDPLGGLLFILPLVILVEGLIILLLFKVSWSKALWVAAAANVVTTVFGFITSGMISIFSVGPLASFTLGLVMTSLTEYPLLRLWLHKPKRLALGVLLMNLSSYALLFIWWLFTPPNRPLHGYFSTLENPALAGGKYHVFYQGDCPMIFVKDLLGWHENSAMADLIKEYAGLLYTIPTLMLLCGLVLAVLLTNVIRKKEENHEA
ncbi:MAG: hypothetical protein JRF33_26155 [Deltaproteobacteria bacterium]|nr:hypothetical protein [Deltaproteobacteria bacterium]